MQRVCHRLAWVTLVWAAVAWPIQLWVLYASGSIPVYKDPSVWADVTGVGIFGTSGILGLASVVLGVTYRGWFGVFAGLASLAVAFSPLHFARLL